MKMTVCDMEHFQKVKYLRLRDAGAIMGQGGLTSIGEQNEPRFSWAYISHYHTDSCFCRSYTAYLRSLFDLRCIVSMFKKDSITF